MAAILRNHPLPATAYAVVFVILAALYVLRLNSLGTIGEAAYAFTVILAAAIAFVAGGLARQRFRVEQRDVYLLLSAGMWVVAALHLYHFAAFTGFLGPIDTALTSAAVLRGALLPTLFFSLFLGLSLLAARHDRPSTAQPGGVFLAAATLGFIVTVASLVFPVPPAEDLVQVFGQPFAPLAAQPEWLLAVALTVIGIAALLHSKRWRTDPLARWLLLAFVLTIVALARIPVVYAWEFAELLLLAQGLTIASYLCVIAGAILRVAGARPEAGVAAAVAPAKSTAKAEAPLAPNAPEAASARPAELALRELQSRHRALRNATDGLLIGLRGDGTITDWKHAADFGPTSMPSEFLGKNIRTALPAEQADAITMAAAVAIQSGNTEQLNFVAADGSVALGGYVAPQVADEVVCIVRDHTAQVRTHEELSASQRAAESLRRVTGDWLITMTRAGAIQDLKPPAAAEFATFADMFAGKHVQEVFLGDDVAPLLAAAEAALAGDSVQELSLSRQSGQVLAVRVTAYGDDTVLCLLRDTTEVHELAAQLQESEDTNHALRGHLDQLKAGHEAALIDAETASRALRDLLPDLVLRLRADGTIVECKSAESFGPPDADKIAGAKAREVLPVDLASQILAAIERAQSDRQPQRFACHPVGGQVLAGGVAALVDDQFLCVVRDQTHMKQMEAALVEQAAVLAQEIRAKLEEEFLRSLRSENDVLRAHLLRIADLARESGGSAPIAGSGVPGPTSQSAGQSPEPTKPAADSSQASETPAPLPKPSGSSSLPPPPSSLQAAARSAAAPDTTREEDGLANKETLQHGAAAVTGEFQDDSAGSAAAEPSTQEQTAVATQEEALPRPYLAENGQDVSKARTNGQPADEEGTSKRGKDRLD